MSKIEDALNKARQTISVKSNEIKTGNSINGLTVSNATKSSVIKHESISKEIALMDDDYLLMTEELDLMKIISPGMKDKKIANTFRNLRTNLIEQCKNDNFIVMVTSTADVDQNGSTLLNLAAAFSFVETKTSLVIDCDLKKPGLDLKLQQENSLGLVDYLENEDVDIESIIYATGIKRVRLIPAGARRESSVEYFTSLRMRQLMEKLLLRYSDRYIFINASPITESADTRILSELCDFVILEVPYATSTLSSVKESVDRIDPSKFLGIVFNNVPKIPKFKLPI